MTSPLKQSSQEAPRAVSSGLSCIIDDKVASFVVSGREYSLHCKDTLEAVSKLKKTWIELENRSSGGFDYFQTFDWCYGWCKHHINADKPNEKTPKVFVLSVESEVCLIWPLMTSRSVAGLNFLESLSEPLGQYSNLLLDPEWVDLDVGRKVWDVIKKSCDVDAVSLNHYPAGNFLDSVLGDEGIDETVQFVSSLLDYSEIKSWDEYIASFSKSHRKQRNRCLRKLEAEGDLTFEVHFHDSQRFAKLVDVAVNLKREWLNETGRHSQSLFEETSKAFLLELGQNSSNLTGEGPVLFSLNLNGKPIALEIGMLKNKHYYSYLGAIDLQWRSFSPGKVQIEFAQKWAFECGVEWFDFLSDPSDYKKSWTNAVKPMKTRYFPISIRGRVYCSFWKAHMKPMLRTMYQRANPNMRKQVNKLLGLSSKTG